MRKKDKKIIDERIVRLIFDGYCQFCENDKCNISEIIGRNKCNWLTMSMMKDVNKFILDKMSCKNHIPSEGFLDFGHIINIYYKDGKIERDESLYTTKEVSKIWYKDKNIANVDIVFTDVL